MRDKVTGEWRRLHNEEFYHLYWSSNVIRVVKTKRMIWAGYVVNWRTGEVYTGFLLGRSEG